MLVDIENCDAIAVVTIDNPPVNATSVAVRQALWDAVDVTERDASIRAVVLACAGPTFIAGADLREMDQPPQDPLLPDLLRRIESATKPWIAAIQGRALGGGLETALACHVRIAEADAMLGFPEVTLGLIPGAGGTVRLPRLVPPEVALDMIVTGKPVDAIRARAVGLLDVIADGRLLDVAMATARATQSARRTLDLPIRAETETGAFDAATAHHLSRTRGQTAPMAAIATLRDARHLPADEAIDRERSAFLSLRDGEQSRALRHLFFAERAAFRIDRIKDVDPMPLSQIGVVGGGTMGAGIAAACLLAGLSVTMVERDAQSVRAGKDRVTAILADSRRRGKLSDEGLAGRLAAFTASATYADLAHADLVIEAVFEDIDAKRGVFARLNEVVRPDAVLATNTSYLDVREIASSTRTPGRVIGLHFFAPAHVMRLLEIVVPDGLDDRTLATGVALAKRLGKTPVLAGVCDGFIANRMMSAYRREAEHMLEDGALPWQIDQAMEDYGFPMGLFKMQDLAGLDISWAMRKRQAANRDPAQRYVRIGDLLCEAGHFGRKTGRGYYCYGQDGMPSPSPETEALILSEASRKGITRRTFDSDTIMDRMLSTMQREGRRILDQGIARCADDIDVAMVLAFGFPRWKGGPMYADGP